MLQTKMQKKQKKKAAAEIEAAQATHEAQLADPHTLPTLQDTSTDHAVQAKGGAGTAAPKEERWWHGELSPLSQTPIPPTLDRSSNRQLLCEAVGMYMCCHSKQSPFELRTRSRMSMPACRF